MTNEERAKLTELLDRLNGGGAGGDGLDVWYDDVFDLSELALADLNTVNAILDQVDEFGHPVDPDSEIPPTAKRVYDRLSRASEENERMRSLLEVTEIGLSGTPDDPVTTEECELLRDNIAAFLTGSI